MTTRTTDVESQSPIFDDDQAASFTRRSAAYRNDSGRLSCCATSKA